MSDSKYSNLGSEISDMVQKAIDSQDFQPVEYNNTEFGQSGSQYRSRYGGFFCSG